MIPTEPTQSILLAANPFDLGSKTPPFDFSTMKIEQNVPLPIQKHVLSKYSLIENKKPADSIAVPLEQFKRTRSAAHRIAHRNKWKMDCRRVVENGVIIGRIWRIE